MEALGQLEGQKNNTKQACCLGCTSEPLSLWGHTRHPHFRPGAAVSILVPGCQLLVSEGEEWQRDAAQALALDSRAGQWQRKRGRGAEGPRPGLFIPPRHNERCAPPSPEKKPKPVTLGLQPKGAEGKTAVKTHSSVKKDITSSDPVDLVG